MKTFAKGKIITILSFTLTLSIVAACGMLASTYAKYTSTITPNSATAEVAEWNFTEDNPTASYTFSLAQSADNSTLNSGMIAPGASGSFAIPLKNSTTETGVDFTISFTTVGSKPTNLKFYKDPEHNTELIPGKDTITGQLAAKDSTVITPTIYWQWPYDSGNDAQDTTDGEAGGDLTVGITITGVQTNPGATPITSHIN